MVVSRQACLSGPAWFAYVWAAWTLLCPHRPGKPGTYIQWNLKNEGVCDVLFVEFPATDTCHMQHTAQGKV